MELKEKSSSRRKFMVWGAAILSGLSMISIGIRTNKKSDTVKMLTREGTLVEIDRRLLGQKKKKIAVDELKNWITRK